LYDSPVKIPAFTAQSFAPRIWAVPVALSEAAASWVINTLRLSEAIPTWS
jgi:hypothetical protein